MEPVIGAEPTTSPLPRVCSTTELHGPRRQRRSQTLERETGLEPATPCLEGRYSSQLSYSRTLRSTSRTTLPLKEACFRKLPFWSESRRLSQKWWTGKDSNLRKRKLTDLQSVPFSHSGTCPRALKVSFK